MPSSVQAKTQRPTPILALDSLAATLGGSVIATVITAVAAGIALVAAAFALYDVVLDLTSPSAAAGITAVALAIVAVLSATIGQRMVRARAAALDRKIAMAKPMMSPNTYRAVGEIGLAVLGFAAERALHHRAQRHRRH